MSNPTGPQDPYSTQPPGDGYGAQPPAGGGYGAPPPPPPPSYSGGPGGAMPGGEKNSLGVWSLVLGIVGILCCGFFTGIPAIIIGKKSKEAQAAGLANNGGLGQAGLVLGWISVGLGILSLVWVFGLGGLAYLSDPSTF